MDGNTYSDAPASGERVVSGVTRWANWRSLVATRQFGIVVAVLALATALIYAFVIAPYFNFLQSDMRGFWLRALARLNGRIFTDDQFLVYPPLYHIFLAEVFRILRTVGLDSLIGLETALTINMVVFGISVYTFHRLVFRWFRRTHWALVCVLLYAFGFPSVYFNAFLLSECLAAPLLVMAVAAVACGENWKSIVAGAILFGLATIIRPSFGPYGLAFIALYLARHPQNWGFNRQFFIQAAIFTATFFVLVIAGSAEVSRISSGKVRSLSANGGLDFFIANSHYHRINLLYADQNHNIIIPSLSLKPENGIFNTGVPFYEQGYYFKKGWEFIQHDPWNLLQNFVYVRNLFFSDMLPTRYDAPGFKLWIPPWHWFKFFMFVTFGLYFWLWRRLDKTETPLFCLLASMIGITILVAFIFTGEPRYTYSILFVFYLLFFKLIELILPDWRAWRKAFLIYATSLVGISGAVVASQQKSYPSTVEIDIQHSNMSPTDTTSERRFIAGRAYFPYDKALDRPPALKHADVVHPPIGGFARIHMRSKFEVKQNSGLDVLPVQFEICSGWPFQIMLNGEPWYFTPTPPEYLSEVTLQAGLKPGPNEIELVVFYRSKPGGIAFNYSYWDKDGWRNRQMLGIDTELVNFMPVED